MRQSDTMFPLLRRQLHGPSASSETALLTVYIVTGILLVITDVGGQEDPCQSYRLLNEVYRSTSYQKEKGRSSLCDIDKPRGWYKFNNVTGGRMPEECVRRFHCGTTAPIWMSGLHPTVADNVVSRTACTTISSTQCCGISKEIQVKNCGDFFVYYLYPTASCPAAYCAGNTIPQPPCPPGKWSANGLEPNCRNDSTPNLTKKPKLEGPNIVERTFVFNCVVDFSDQDTDQRLEVAWLFDGQEDSNIRGKILSDPERTATLDGTLLKGHIGQEVGCKVRAFYQNGNALELATPWLTSNVYWAGLKVEPRQLEVSEDGTNSDMTVTSTIPLVCNHDDTKDCVITLALDEGENAAATKCAYKLSASNWSTSINSVTTTITVAAIKRKLLNGDRHTFLKFKQIGQSVAGQYLEIFTNYTVQPVQVVVKDVTPSKCHMEGDPHIHGFNGNYYQLYEVGVFTMYENTEDNFEFQIQTYLCNKIVSCICGVAIKEQQDVIRIDGCADSIATSKVEYPTRKLREGTKVERSSDGKEITIYFPSQREVKIVGSDYNNVYLTVPGADIQGNNGGICGTLAKNITKDQFKYRDGTIHRSCDGSDCVPTDFVNSWKVDSEDKNLFKNVPQPTDIKNNASYCQCDESSPDRLIDCNVDTRVNDQLLPCPNCGMVLVGNNRGKRDTANGSPGTEDEDEPDPPTVFETSTSRNRTISWPTPSGITEAAARERCMQGMQSSQLWGHCGQMTSVVNNNLKSCMTDVMLGDSFSWVESALISVTTQCQQNLALDPSNYVQSSNGKLVLKAEISTEVCSTFCLRHGTCVKGQCVCEAGYAGDNCQLDATKGPQLQSIRSSRYCDGNQRPCKKVFIDATNFQNGNSFLCKIREIRENEQQPETVFKEKAEFVTSNRLTCPLPDARIKTERWIKTYNISVSNDDQLYGNELQVVVFDSTCQACTESSGCTQKVKIHCTSRLSEDCL